MANRFFQGIIHQLSDVVDRKIGVLDDSGNIIACNAIADIGNAFHGYTRVQSDENGVIRYEGHTFKPLVGTENSGDYGEYTVFVAGTDDLSVHSARFIAISLENLKQFFDDKYDKSNFVKNILFDNVLPSDVYAKAKDLGFSYDTERQVIIVRIDGKAKGLLSDLLQKSMGEKLRYYLVSVNEREAAVVLELGEDWQSGTGIRLARKVAEDVSSLGGVHCTVGAGTIAGNLRELARSYREAQLALDVGSVFNHEVNVVSYDNLGIGRLIYQMPTTLCEMFLQEVFNHGSIECLDEETLTTIEKFFENNLNVSETARKLFVHRNTLVYRLEKIKKMTGLDIRDFDNAIIFKVALMVNNYLSSSNNKF